MESDKHKTMSPKELWLTRPQYQKFSLKVFRDHLYQWRDTLKWYQDKEKASYTRKVKEKSTKKGKGKEKVVLRVGVEEAEVEI